MVDTVLLEPEKQLHSFIGRFSWPEPFRFFSHFLGTTNNIEVEMEEAQCFLFKFLI